MINFFKLLTLLMLLKSASAFSAAGPADFWNERDYATFKSALDTYDTWPKFRKAMEKNTTLQRYYAYYVSLILQEEELEGSLNAVDAERYERLDQEGKLGHVVEYYFESTINPTPPVWDRTVAQEVRDWERKAFLKGFKQGIAQGILGLFVPGL